MGRNYWPDEIAKRLLRKVSVEAGVPGGEGTKVEPAEKLRVGLWGKFLDGDAGLIGPCPASFSIGWRDRSMSGVVPHRLVPSTVLC